MKKILNKKNKLADDSRKPCVGIVVPTIREASIKRFLDEWRTEFASYPNLKIFIVEDNPKKSFSLKTKLPVYHFDWSDIEKDLGGNSWIIPRRTDCIRSYGYYKAYKAGVDIMITLDDDCYPVQKNSYLIREFMESLDHERSTSWFNTLSGRMMEHKYLYPRGFPYADRNKKVVLCHGLWNNIPDFDGKTQIQNQDIRVAIHANEATPVPRNVFYPMCGMNVAVRREVIPIFYFLLMGMNKEGKPWGIDRFGDIWAGLFSKKIIDHMDRAVVSGKPVIHHDRASDALKNIKLESKGIKQNEALFKHVATMKLTGKSYLSCYRELARKLPNEGNYFPVLKKSMLVWADLFD